MGMLVQVQGVQVSRKPLSKDTPNLQNSAFPDYSDTRSSSVGSEGASAVATSCRGQNTSDTKTIELATHHKLLAIQCLSFTTFGKTGRDETFTDLQQLF